MCSKSLSDNQHRIVLADLETLGEHVPTPQDIGASVTDLRCGMSINFEGFAKDLALGGFREG